MWEIIIRKEKKVNDKQKNQKNIEEEIPEL